MKHFEVGEDREGKVVTNYFSKGKCRQCIALSMKKYMKTEESSNSINIRSLHSWRIWNKSFEVFLPIEFIKLDSFWHPKITEAEQYSEGRVGWCDPSEVRRNNNMDSCVSVSQYYSGRINRSQYRSQQYFVRIYLSPNSTIIGVSSQDKCTKMSIKLSIFITW